MPNALLNNHVRIAPHDVLKRFKGGFVHTGIFGLDTFLWE